MVWTSEQNKTRNKYFTLQTWSRTNKGNRTGKINARKTWLKRNKRNVQEEEDLLRTNCFSDWDIGRNSLQGLTPPATVKQTRIRWPTLQQLPKRHCFPGKRYPAGASRPKWGGDALVGLPLMCVVQHTIHPATSVGEQTVVMSITHLIFTLYCKADSMSICNWEWP